MMTMAKPLTASGDEVKCTSTLQWNRAIRHVEIRLFHTATQRESFIFSSKNTVFDQRNSHPSKNI